MKKTIVCFGDSNTHGYCAETGGRYDYDNRWPGILADLLGADYHVIEEGLSGRTTVFEDPLHEGLSGLSAIRPILMTHEPIHLLIIMLGTNDTKERFRATAANIGRGLERLIRKAYSVPEAYTCGIPKILVVTPPPIDEKYEGTTIGAEMGMGCATKSKELARYYQNAATATSSYYMDAGAISRISMNPKDHMHLTGESHKLLAEEIATFINHLV